MGEDGVFDVVFACEVLFGLDSIAHVKIRYSFGARLLTHIGVGVGGFWRA